MANKYLDYTGLGIFWAKIKLYIAGLSGSITGTPSASKTITSYSDSGGKTTVVFGDINIAKTQVKGEGTGKTLVDDLALKANLDDPDFTGTPTVPTADANTNNTQIANTAWVWSAIEKKMADTDAMRYMGTLAGGSTGAYGALTPAAGKGDTYKVTTAGKIDGVAVEIGDMLICNTDGTAAATSSNYSTIAGKWDFIQTNIDGAVTGPTSATDGHIAVFDGTTGKKIKDTGFTIATSVPANAVFTDTDTKVTSVGNHYAPAEDANAAINAASGTVTQLPTGSSGGTRVNVVTGLKRDAKGHVVGVVSKDIWSANTTYSNPSLGQTYGTCNTAAATASKTVTKSNYALADGGIVAIKFTEAICANATLNINSKGAKAIFVNGAAVNADTAKVIHAGDIAYFIYDSASNSSNGAYHFLGTDKASQSPIIGITRSGTTFTYTCLDGTTGTFDQQDNDHDTKVTSADNHYTPATVSGKDKSASASGATAAWSIDVVKGITLNTDGKGHVTGISVTSGKIPANPNTDTKVTSVDNHYAPAEDSNAELSANASGATAAWSIDVVKGVTIKRDAKGHVVGIAVTSGKLPANPNTDTKQNITSSTSKAYITGVTTAPTNTATALTGVANSSVYMQSGELYSNSTKVLVTTDFVAITETEINALT